ncbi:arylsulfatase L-like [Leptodactylus fuscus]|uniref:arylsulfatase L-like n=1 Tax=Leptodactylus fuscus TaxID=238119 RepID=UPI003F4F359E
MEDESKVAGPSFPLEKMPKLLKLVRPDRGETSEQRGPRSFRVEPALARSMETEWKRPERSFQISRRFRTLFPVEEVEGEDWSGGASFGGDADSSDKNCYEGLRFDDGSCRGSSMGIVAHAPPSERDPQGLEPQPLRADEAYPVVHQYPSITAMVVPTEGREVHSPARLDPVDHGCVPPWMGGASGGDPGTRDVELSGKFPVIQLARVMRNSPGPATLLPSSARQGSEDQDGQHYSSPLYKQTGRNFLAILYLFGNRHITASNPKPSFVLMLADDLGIGDIGCYGNDTISLSGSIVNAIDNAGLKNNTMVYFASDHGGHLEATDGKFQTGGWNGIYRGGKAMAGWEGGIRVPGILRWPGVIPSDIEIDEPTSLMDIYPTVVYLGGGELPNDRIIDGRNLIPLVTRQSAHSEHEFLFHYCGQNLHAVRWHQKESGAIWKAHYMTPVFFPEGAGRCYDTVICACEGDRVAHHEPPLLFELSADPSESNPLDPHVDPQYKTVLDRINTAAAEHQKTINVVPQQFSFLNNLWRPWLQPCCGTFPFCWCDKEEGNATEILQ